LPLTGRTLQEAECLAGIRLAQTAVALEQYRHAHQSYPDTLAALVPDYLPIPPADPFRTAPLQYEKRTQGYVLQSLGPPARMTTGMRGSYRPGDLTLTVDRPSRRS
jgi:hypothetical protein